MPRDARPIQSALAFYANPPLSEGGTSVGCTVLVEARQLGRARAAARNTSLTIKITQEKTNDEQTRVRTHKLTETVGWLLRAVCD
jgi:hypothetical protein